MANTTTPVGVFKVGNDTFCVIAEDDEPIHLDEIPRTALVKIWDALGINGKVPGDLGLRTQIAKALDGEDDDVTLWLDKVEDRHDLEPDVEAPHGDPEDEHPEPEMDAPEHDGDGTEDQDEHPEDGDGDAEADAEGEPDESDESEDESESDGEGEGKGESPPIDFHVDVHDPETGESKFATMPAEDLFQAIQGMIDEAVKAAVRDEPMPDLLDRFQETPDVDMPTYEDPMPVENQAEYKDGGRLFHAMEPEILAALAGGQHVFLYGPPGTGKSHLGVRYSERTGQQLDVVSCHPHLTVSALVGYFTPEGLKKGPLCLSAESEGVFLGDELDNTGPGIHASFNSTMANNLIQIGDLRIQVGPKWRFIGTANTIGAGATSDFVGRQRLDAATLDRMASFFIDTDPVLEHNLLVAMGLDRDTRKEWLGIVYRMRHNVEINGIRTFVSMRTTLAGARQILLQRTAEYKRLKLPVLEPMDIARQRVLNKLPKDQALKVLA